MKSERVDCSKERPYWADAKPFPRAVAHPIFYTREQIERARRRASSYDWGKAYLDALVSRVEASGILEMPDEAIRAEISEQVTFPLPRCPVDRGQRSWRENFWTWSPEDRAHVRCETCGAVLPGAEHEATGELEVVGPSGKVEVYRYWEDAGGVRYFFENFVRFCRQKWVTDLAPTLARAYVLTEEKAYAHKAAVIVARMAEVYPNYPAHGFGQGFGNADKQGYYENHFYREAPYPFVSSRWANFAVGPYVDAAYGYEVAQAYDLISDSGAIEALSEAYGRDVRAAIERDLLYEAARHTLEVERRLTNYQGRFIMAMGLVGRLLDEAAFVREAYEVYRLLIDNSFYYDGFWCEDTLNYFGMIVGSVLEVPHVLGGAGGIDVHKERPFLPRIYTAPLGLHFPDGSTFPVNDTWARTLRPKARGLANMAPFVEAADELAGRSRIPVAKPEFALFRRSSEADRQATEADLLALVPENDLLPGAGDAVLGIGRGADAVRTTLYFGPWSGHHHYDTLAMSLYAMGRELLSDIGYTWSVYRPWATSAASHNTVVVDGREQTIVGGRLLGYRPASETRVGMVCAEAPGAFEGVAVYRRTVLLVPTGPDSGYVVDVFEVEGGGTHDYLLHGAADFDQTASAELALSPAEGELAASGAGAAYGYLRNVRAGNVGGDCSVRFAGEGVSVDVRFVGAEGDRLLVGEGPSVRRAQDADHRLDAFSYPVVCLRKRGGRSRFVSVIEAHRDGGCVRRVRLLEDGGRGIVLQVEEKDRVRVFGIDPSGGGVEAAMPDGRRFVLEGRAGLFCDGALEIVEGSRLAVGDAVREQVGGYEGVVTEVVGDLSGHPDRSELVVDIRLPDDGTLAGKVISVTHPSGKETAYVIERVEKEGAGSRVVLAGMPRFVWGRAEVVSGERGRFESGVEQPMRYTYPGCRVRVGGRVFAVRAVEGLSGFVTEEAEDFGAMVGETFEVFSTAAGDRVRVVV